MAAGGERRKAAASVGVVVAAYESDDVLPDLLDSLAEHEPDFPVVVVDDASPSGPPEVAGCQIVISTDNLGFAAACNRGTDVVRDLGVRYVAFLNPDVRLQGPSLTELATEMDERDKVGLATGPLENLEGQRIPSAWGPTSVRRAFSFAAGLEPARLRAAAGPSMRGRVSTSDASTMLDDLRVEGHVIGGSMFARIDCLDELDGFDEDFFLYWEDADLCHRARGAGWQVRLLPCTPLVNTRDALTTDGISDEQRWQWYLAGATRFGDKHLVPGQAMQLRAALDVGRRIHQLRQRG